jgi:GTPase SAR1 family protein
MHYIYFVGTAGSGKSSLVYSFKEWMTLQGLDCITVNLDPGAEFVPYDIDVDIRDWVRVQDVMEEYQLGPNGAQIVCADLMAVRVNELVEAIEGFKTPYVLIDTPGQIELFAFRKSSEVIIDAMGKEDSFLVFLSDPHLSKTPVGFVSSMMLCATTIQVRPVEGRGHGPDRALVRGARGLVRRHDRDQHRPADHVEPGVLQGHGERRDVSKSGPSLIRGQVRSGRYIQCHTAKL